MSGFDAEREAIETRFAAQWAGQTPISWDNSAFTIPAGQPWVRLTILNGDGLNAALGTSYTRFIGIISIQVFVPEDSGTKNARDLADNVAAIFTNARFAGIQCRVASITRAGNNNGWAQFNVTIPFRRDHNA